MNAQLIETQSDLEKIIEKLQYEDYLSIDTEFDRRRTYFAKLSIVQINSSIGIFIIDALKVKDLNALKQILCNDQIVKIFHAAEQDFEIFYNMFRIIPKNIFDTQIAASYSGYRKDMGYGLLCEQICKVTINKKLQNTNWLIRPLSDIMIEYLISDVLYLKEIYFHLKDKLDKGNKYKDFQQKIERTFNISSFKYNPDKELSKIKIPKNFSNAEKIILKNIVILRNDFAIQRNVPRKYIATNNDILSIAYKKPQTLQDLKKISFESKLLYKEKLGNNIIDIIQAQNSS